MSNQSGFFGRHRTLVGVGVVTIVIAAVAPAVTALASSTPAGSPIARRFQAVSVAIPSAHNPAAADLSARVSSTDATDLHVVTSATASSTCDSCQGQAVTMQVVYADRGTVITADNAATAWSANCTQCEGAALSLQIVVTGSGVSVTANNRALSTNAACLKCRTVSAAVQLVVRAPSTAKLSRQAMMQIRALRNDLLANLTAYAPTSGTFRARTSAPASAPRVSGPMQATTKQLQSVVSSDLGATSATHRIVVR